MTTIFTRLSSGWWLRHRSKVPVLQIHTPHVPLGETSEFSVSLLQSMGCELVGEDGRARCFQPRDDDFSITVHAADDMVTSVVYDDPAGRYSKDGRAEKIRLYLARYGAYSNWEMRMRNDWMHYWFNPADKVAMVYGINMDVLRFNRYDGV
jgi:hypothetical protein